MAEQLGEFLVQRDAMLISWMVGRGIFSKAVSRALQCCRRPNILISTVSDPPRHHPRESEAIELQAEWDVLKVHHPPKGVLGKPSNLLIMI